MRRGRLISGTALISATLVLGFLTLHSFVVAEFRFGAAEALTAPGHVGFVPLSDGEFVAYVEGCKDPESVAAPGGSVVRLCSGDAVEILHLATGARGRIEDAPALGVGGLGPEDPYLLADGTWPTTGGVIDLANATVKPAPWGPFFHPTLRDGPWVFGVEFGSDGAERWGNWRYDLDDRVAPVLMTFPGSCRMEPGDPAHLVRARGGLLLAAWCGRLWLADAAADPPFEWTAFDTGTDLRQSSSGARLLADFAGGRLALARTPADGPPEGRVYGIASGTLERIHELPRAGTSRLEALFAHGERWTVSYALRGDGGGYVGYYQGTFTGDEVRRIELDDPTVQGQVPTRAFPVGDRVFYDAGGDIYMARPGKGFLPLPWSLAATGAGVAASGIWWTRPFSFWVRGGASCAKCGAPLQGAVSFCVSCGSQGRA